MMTDTQTTEAREKYWRDKADLADSMGDPVSRNLYIANADALGIVGGKGEMGAVKETLTISEYSTREEYTTLERRVEELEAKKV